MSALALGPPRRLAACHPDQPHYALGQCEDCYVGSRTGQPTASCHPRRFAYRDGRCRACWQHAWYQSVSRAPQLTPVVGVETRRTSMRVAVCPKCGASAVREHPGTRFMPAQLSCRICGWDSYLVRE